VEEEVRHEASRGSVGHRCVEPLGLVPRSSGPGWDVMVFRLVDLLDRIRPAGAPGALVEEGTLRSEQAVELEVAELRRRLLEIDAEAAELVDAARRDAAEIVAEGARVARQRRAELADRVAVAGGQDAAAEDERAEQELARLRDDTERAVATLRDAFDAHAAELVDAAVAVIWRDLGPEPGGDA
jgi:hypothetical protein